jgi:hypothetical protein
VHPIAFVAGALLILLVLWEGAADLPLRDVPEVNAKLDRLRRMYEPTMTALSEYLMMPLPRWVSSERARDIWQSML